MARTKMTDVDGMITLAREIAATRGHATYLQPTYRGLALVEAHQLVGFQYYEARPDGTVIRHSLDGNEEVA